MPRGKRKAPAVLDPTGLVGFDVEVRTTGGGCHRGQLEAVGDRWLALRRRTGRLALLELSSVTAVLDEQAARERSADREA